MLKNKILSNTIVEVRLPQNNKAPEVDALEAEGAIGRERSLLAGDY